MYLQEELAREKVRSMLAEARQSGLVTRTVALRRARRRAERVSARLRRAERAVVQLRGSMHAQW